MERQDPLQHLTTWINSGLDRTCKIRLDRGQFSVELAEPGHRYEWCSKDINRATFGALDVAGRSYGAIELLTRGDDGDE